MTSFRTKRGRCIIDEDTLYLSSSYLGQMKRYWEGGKFYFTVMLLVIPYIIYMLATANRYFWIGGLIGIGIIGVSYIINHFRGFSYDYVIPREKIQSFTAVEGSKGFTRPRFIVEFEKNGEVRKRYIMMPSKLLSYGEEEFEKAQRIMSGIADGKTE